MSSCWLAGNELLISMVDAMQVAIKHVSFWYINATVIDGQWRTSICIVAGQFDDTEWDSGRDNHGPLTY